MMACWVTERKALRDDDGVLGERAQSVVTMTAGWVAGRKALRDEEGWLGDLAQRAS